MTVQFEKVSQSELNGKVLMIELVITISSLLLINGQLLVARKLPLVISAKVRKLNSLNILILETLNSDPMCFNGNDFLSMRYQHQCKTKKALF